MDERPIRTRPDTKKNKKFSSRGISSRPRKRRRRNGNPPRNFSRSNQRTPRRNFTSQCACEQAHSSLLLLRASIFFFFNLLTEHTSRVLLERVLQLLCVYPGRFPRGLETKPQQESPFCGERRREKERESICIKIKDRERKREFETLRQMFRGNAIEKFRQTMEKNCANNFVKIWVIKYKI